MTDQDPTQAYQPPEAPPPAAPPAPPAAVPPAPPAAASYAPPAASYAPPAFASPEPAATPGIDPAASPGTQFGAYPGTEPVAQPVATSPVAASTAPRAGRSRVKWLVAAVVTLLVAGGAAGATLLLTGSSADPAVLTFAPANTLMYAEARLDLPGSQAAELAKVMKAFPGFEDQAAFGTKLSEALDQLVDKASDGKMGYKADIEPWFNGQVSMSMVQMPAASDPSKMQAVLLVGTKDATLAKAWADKLLADAGGKSTTESYAGTTITIVEGSSSAMADVKVGYAVAGPVLAVGDLTSLHAVIDTQGKTGLPTNAQFKDATKSLTGDRLGFLYADYGKLLDALAEISASVPGQVELPKSLLDKMPPWIIETFRVADSGFLVETRVPHSDLNNPASESKLPGRLPSSTIVMLDGHDLGASLKQARDLYADLPVYKDALKQIDDALAVLGGFDAVTSWMGEAAIVVTRSGDQVAGGIAVVPTDKADAERLLNQLKGFVQLGGAQAGITVSEEDYKGTTITVIDLSSLAGLAGSSLTPGMELPSEIKLAYAVTDDIVVLGYGTDFVKSVLDAPTAGSLAASPRFADAIKRVGASNSGVLWVDVAAIRDAAEGFIPSEAKGTYDSDVKPYLAAFDYIIAASTPGSPYDTGTVLFHVAGQ